MSISLAARSVTALRREHRLAGWWLAPVLLWLALLLPAHPDDFGFKALMVIPLELPVLMLAVLFVPAPVNGIFRCFLAAVLLILVLMRLADVGSYLAFDRAFSPLVEWHLLGDGWNLASSTIGRTEATIVIGLILLSMLGVVWLLLISLTSLSVVVDPFRRRLIIGCVALVACIIPALYAEQALEGDWPVAGGVPAEVWWRVKAMRSSIADQTDFIKALAEDPVLDVGKPAFKAIAGRDVLVLFVESYGRSFLDLDPMKKTALTRLLLSDSALAEAGFARRSGWVESPIRGGRSWLAHSTFMSGLRINNQARFDRLISSDRVSLNRLFAGAGWQTVGVMPAIQFDWPEGRWYGFDRILMKQDLGYRGKPFGWVTMPDQYTLSALQRLRERTDRPLMAEVALISSHVPWTPIPKLLPWSNLDDGRVFDGSQRDEPPIVWKDRPGVQALYSRSLDYSLQVITDYVARFADDALVIIIGDHQPTAIIDGWGKTADVPVHIISKDKASLSRLPDLNFSSGMLPGDTLQSLPMQSMRGLLSHIFENH